MQGDRSRGSSVSQREDARASEGRSVPRLSPAARHRLLLLAPTGGAGHGGRPAQLRDSESGTRGRQGGHPIRAPSLRLLGSANRWPTRSVSARCARRARSQRPGRPAAQLALEPVVGHGRGRGCSVPSAAGPPCARWRAVRRSPTTVPRIQHAGHRAAGAAAAASLYWRAPLGACRAAPQSGAAPRCWWRALGASRDHVRSDHTQGITVRRPGLAPAGSAG